MTTKLTLTIEDQVIDSAKDYARKNGRSLSVIVENYLKSITISDETPKPLSPKVIELMGSIKLPADFNYKKELGKAFVRKYK